MRLVKETLEHIFYQTMNVCGMIIGFAMTLTGWNDTPVPLVFIGGILFLVVAFVAFIYRQKMF